MFYICLLYVAGVKEIVGHRGNTGKNRNQIGLIRIVCVKNYITCLLGVL